MSAVVVAIGYKFMSGRKTPWGLKFWDAKIRLKWTYCQNRKKGLWLEDQALSLGLTPDPSGGEGKYARR